MASPASRNPAIQEYMPLGYLGSRRIRRSKKLTLEKNLKFPILVDQSKILSKNNPTSNS